MPCSCRQWRMRSSTCCWRGVSDFKVLYIYTVLLQKASVFLRPGNQEKATEIAPVATGKDVMLVGTADFTLGEAVAEVLEAHVRAGGGRFRGIRQSAAWAPAGEAIASRMAPPHLYMDAKFRAGYAQLARFNMIFEGWCYHHQIKELTDLARAFPDITIILDHFGGPLGVGPYAGKREEMLPSWRQDVTELAKCANVVAKLGGINMSINGFGW
ncbi:hypothetical protein C2W62_26085, partial [Candidatus Entotheonella serta]